MIMKPKARKFRIRRSEVTQTAAAAPAAMAHLPEHPRHVDQDSTAREILSAMNIDEIRREGLTGRQLRMARRLALKHGLAPSSDFDAVRLLRARGIDPTPVEATHWIDPAGALASRPPKSIRRESTFEPEEARFDLVEAMLAYLVERATLQARLAVARAQGSITRSELEQRRDDYQRLRDEMTDAFGNRVLEGSR